MDRNTHWTIWRDYPCMLAVLGGMSNRVPSSKVEPTEENRSPHTNGVGSVQESDVDHWKRHSTELASIQCCRCKFIRHKADLQREHPWLKARPSFMGGHWRLGCDVCHWMSSNQGGKGIVDVVGAKCVPRDSLLAILYALDLIEWHVIESTHTVWD